ncbi:MAG: YHS domain-containing protein [Planctomycetia bacterium]|nr:YHS domain-containing protein [Planctomycetia bacterium]
MAIKVGVMGGASDISTPGYLEKAHALGRAIARRGAVLITGACPGLPLAAACGAKQSGGMVVGVSPAISLEEHIQKYSSPTEFHDVLIFTGNGLMGREVINIRSSDIVVIVGGRSGTLGELAIAYDEGKLIGVLTGMGGISDLVKDILTACAKDTGSRVVYEADPELLVAELLRLFHLPRDVAPGGPSQPGAIAMVEDPVCRMRILPQAAAAERDWEGKRYLFCSAACGERFDADPRRYTEGHESQAR